MQHILNVQSFGGKMYFLEKEENCLNMCYFHGWIGASLGENRGRNIDNFFGIPCFILLVFLFLILFFQNKKCLGVLR